MAYDELNLRVRGDVNDAVRKLDQVQAGGNRTADTLKRMGREIEQSMRAADDVLEAFGRTTARTALQAANGDANVARGIRQREAALRALDQAYVRVEKSAAAAFRAEGTKNHAAALREQERAVNALASAQTRLLQVSQQAGRAQAAAGFGRGFLGNVNLPGGIGIGSLGGGAVAAGAAAAGLGAVAFSQGKEAVNLYREEAQALRFLSSVTRELGESYDDALAASRRFARQVGAVDDGQAADVYTRARLALRQAGDPVDTETFLRRIADAAASRGQKVTDLPVLLRGLYTDDLVYDKLGLSNPSKIQEEAARKLGRELSEVEKKQVLLNAVMEIGARNVGESSRALETNIGKWDALEKRLDSIKSKLGDFIANNPIATALIGGAEGVVGSIELARANSAKGLLSPEFVGSGFVPQLALAAAYARSQYTPRPPAYQAPVAGFGSAVEVEQFFRAYQSEIAQYDRTGAAPGAAGPQFGERLRLAREFRAQEAARQIEIDRIRREGGLDLNRVIERTEYFRRYGVDQPDPFAALEEQYRARNDAIFKDATDPETKQVRITPQIAERLDISEQQRALEITEQLLRTQTEINRELDRARAQYASATGNPYLQMFQQAEEAARQARAQFGAAGEEIAKVIQRTGQLGIAGQISSDLTRYSDLGARRFELKYGREEKLSERVNRAFGTAGDIGRYAFAALEGFSPQERAQRTQEFIAQSLVSSLAGVDANKLGPTARRVYDQALALEQQRVLRNAIEGLNYARRTAVATEKIANAVQQGDSKGRAGGTQEVRGEFSLAIDVKTAPAVHTSINAAVHDPAPSQAVLSQRYRNLFDAAEGFTNGFIIPVPPDPGK